MRLGKAAEGGITMQIVIGIAVYIAVVALIVRFIAVCADKEE